MGNSTIPEKLATLLEAVNNIKPQLEDLFERLRIAETDVKVSKAQVESNRREFNYKCKEFEKSLQDCVRFARFNLVENAFKAYRVKQQKFEKDQKTENIRKGELTRRIEVVESICEGWKKSKRRTWFIILNVAKWVVQLTLMVFAGFIVYKGGWS